MEWIIDIENKPKYKIKVKFIPEQELIIFTGIYKIDKWYEFSSESHPMEITLEQIQDNIFKAYEKMEKRVNAYNNILEGFSIIKKIEISE